MQAGPGGYLADIVCADDGRSLWTVNDAGGIWHTSDGGSTWVAQSPPAGFDITAGFAHVACLNAQVAWAFTPDGRAIRTSDGGATWRVWDSVPATGLYDVLPVGSTGTVIWASAETGRPSFFVDSGATWDSDWADTVASLAKGVDGGSGTVHAGIAAPGA